MIRILHTADWHLGQTFLGYDRTGEHKAFLDWLAEEIRQNEIDALVIAGDVFDVSNPSAASQRIYYEFIYRVTAENSKLQIVIVHSDSYFFASFTRSPAGLAWIPSSSLIALIPVNHTSLT